MQAAAHLVTAVLLLLLLLVCPPALARPSMPAKCSACRAVAEVLETKLEQEVPRNHLDMRHRLDKHGKRYGKVIDYKMSELRVIDLLDGLCDGLSTYEFVEEDKEAGQKARWAPAADLGANRKVSTHLIKEQRKELLNYCADLLERHEDVLSAALRNGELDTERVSDFLCFETAAHCDAPVLEVADEAGAALQQEAPQQEEKEQPAASGVLHDGEL